MKNFQDKIVLITGASGGVGKNLAMEFAKEKSILILTDINELLLNKLKLEIRKKYKIDVYSFKVDVTKTTEVKKLAEKVLKQFEKIDILINNAGIGYSKELAETDITQFKKLFEVNFWGPIYHTQAFLPSMIKNKSGHIVNVSSGQAFFRLPTWGAYAVTKLALGAYSEILKHELRKFKINLTTCYPFMINTGFYDEIKGENYFQQLSMKLVPYYSMTPEKVAKIIFKAIKKKKSVEMISSLNRIAKLSHFIPFMWDSIGFITAKTLGKKPEEMIFKTIQ